MGSAYCADSPCDMALGTFYADVYDIGYVALHPLFGDDGRYDVYYIYGLHDELYSLGVLHSISSLLPATFWPQAPMYGYGPYIDY